MNTRNVWVILLLLAAGTSVSLSQFTPKETLKASYSASRPGTAVTASCNSLGCVATPVSIFSRNFTCPATAGQTCTYDIQIAGQVRTFGNASNTDGELGTYQFLIDGAIPSGGGTDSSGYYAWQSKGPVFLFGTSYNVHSKVKNTVANQAHTIAVNVSCQEIINDANGCTGQAGFSTLVVRVWVP